jgi:hypothetical protein
MEHRYNQRNLSPKAFLLEVMWDETVEMPHRLQAADALQHWIELGEFRDPDIRYVIPEQQLQ